MGNAKKTWTHQCIPATHSSSIWLEGYSTFIWGVKPSKAKLHFGFLCPKNLISHNISFLASKRLKCSAHLATSARCGTTRHNWRKAADPSPDVSLAAASKLDRRAATWLVVGGWTTHLKNMLVKMGSSSPNGPKFREKNTYLKPLPSKWFTILNEI